MHHARRYLVRGRVQGVGFRYFTHRAASRAGVHGWVRNHPDGSVEILAEGEAAALEQFEREVRQGPPGARVEGFSFSETPPGGAFTEFSIR